MLPLFLALLEVPCSPFEVWKSSTRLHVCPAYGVYKCTYIIFGFKSPAWVPLMPKLRRLSMPPDLFHGSLYVGSSHKSDPNHSQANFIFKFLKLDKILGGIIAYPFLEPVR